MRFLVSVFFLIFSVSVHAIDVKPSLSGSWFNPAQNGHGFSIEVIDQDTTVVYWYVYDHDREPIFLVGVGKNQGSKVVADVYYQDGLKFGEFNGNDLNQRRWGSLTLDFHSCDRSTLSYNSNMEHSGEVFGSGTIELEKLLSIAGNKCREFAPAGIYHASFIYPGEVGIGIATVFENGVTAYFAANDYGAVSGFGEMTLHSNNRFEIQVGEYVFDGSYGEYVIQGEFDRDSMTGSTNTGASIIATRTDATFMDGVTYQQIQGTYDLKDEFENYSGWIEIKSNGQLIGSSIDGCDISGEVIIPDPEFNQYWVEAELKNCSNATWIAAAGAYDREDDLLIFIGATGYRGFLWYAD